MRDAISRTVADAAHGSGTTLIVEGVAGAGKTSLLQARIPPFDPDAAPIEAGDDAAFPTVHGLHWLVERAWPSPARWR